MLQTTLYARTLNSLRNVIEDALQGYDYRLELNRTSQRGGVIKVYRLEGTSKTAYLRTDLNYKWGSYRMEVTLEGDPSEYPQLSIALIQFGGQQ